MALLLLSVRFRAVAVLPELFQALHPEGGENELTFTGQNDPTFYLQAYDLNEVQGFMERLPEIKPSCHSRPLH